MKGWFLKILSSKDDKNNEYKLLREKLKIRGNSVWHYPHRLINDFLIIEKDGKAQQSIIGGHTKPAKDKLSIYCWGILIADSTACGNLKDSFLNILTQDAKKHAETEKHRIRGKKCFCSIFYNEEYEKLLPR